ncbi:signal transduction histidine kinase regulating citrate/malate metabolism [Alkaliphilus metalliredigens QYMF]|uniref:Signal transduction histidine kinase regulating citrate/malate metabolism n=1 Tax=Alkaliphilus metalliredigens (strain QYMF) TaxID=293826 RepID=A6TQJ5_ALKMQ|nr:Spo0B domain-containing protein [Alkaliphilus metalliredigens]ABR48463.1 signal transduction histidine kinase regulating citrate/malate metabolism [Alkaliphilus metalliredigens QYMF]
MDANTQRKIEIHYWNEIEQLLTNQRHDFMNTLQTVYGYIQLGQPEKAVEQIKQVTNYANQMGRVFNLQCVPLAMLITETMKLNTIGENCTVIEVQSFVTMEDYIEINVEAAIEQVKKLLENILKQFNESKSQEVIHMKIEEHEMCWIFFVKYNKFLEKATLDHMLVDLQLQHTYGDDMVIVYFKLKKTAKQ